MSLPNFISACILPKAAQGLSLQLHHLDGKGATIRSAPEGRLEQSENAITAKLGTDLDNQIRQNSAFRWCKVISEPCFAPAAQGWTCTAPEGMPAVQLEDAAPGCTGMCHSLHLPGTGWQASTGHFWNKPLHSSWSQGYFLFRTLGPELFRGQAAAGMLHLFDLTCKYHVKLWGAMTEQHCSDTETFQLWNALCPGSFSQGSCRGGNDAAYQEGFVCHRIRLYII